MTIEDVTWPSDQDGRPVVVGSTDQGALRVGEALNLIAEDGTVRGVNLRGVEGVMPLEPGLSKRTRLHLLLGDDLEVAEVAVGQRLATPDATPGDESGVREPRRQPPPRRPDATAAISLDDK